MILGYICTRIMALTIAGHFEKEIDARKSKNEWKWPQSVPTHEFPSPREKPTRLTKEIKPPPSRLKILESNKTGSDKSRLGFCGRKSYRQVGCKFWKITIFASSKADSAFCWMPSTAIRLFLKLCQQLHFLVYSIKRVSFFLRKGRFYSW